MFMRLAPVLFVLLWSTGFIGSKLGSPYAEPFTFLSLRYLIVVAILLPVVLIGRRRVEGWRARGHSVIVGVLLHGIYLGGVFFAIDRGMPAGVASVIVSLQPVLTAVLAAPLLGEVTTRRHWLGLALGFGGVLLVVAPGLQGAVGAPSGIGPATLAAAVIGLLAITCGTIYQKRFSTGTDLLAGALWQYVGALAVAAAGAFLFETRTVDWTAEFTFALFWLVFVLSIGAISLLMLLIRAGSVARVSGLFYLVPAVTAVIAFLMFGETLAPLQLAGFVLVTIAVLMISGVRLRRTPA